VEFSIKSGSPEKTAHRLRCGRRVRTTQACLGRRVDRSISNHYLSDIIRRGDMEGKSGTTLMLHNVPNTLCDRVLLVGLGKEREFKDKEYRDAIRAAIKTLNESGSLEVSVFLTELPVKRRDTAWKVEQAVLMAMEGVYRFDQLKSKQEEMRRPLRRIVLNVSRRTELSIGEEAAKRGQAIADGMNIAKDLGKPAGQHLHPGLPGSAGAGAGKKPTSSRLKCWNRKTWKT